MPPKAKTADSVQRIYDSNPEAFHKLVESCGGAPAFCKRFGGGTTLVYKLEYASRERMRSHRETEDAAVLRELLNASEAQNESLRDTYSQLTSMVRVINSMDPVVPEVTPAPEDVDEHMGIFLLSDSQVGSFVREQHTGGLESYNKDVFDSRVNTYLSAVDSIFVHTLQRSFPIRRSWVFLLGDILEGEGIYPLQHANLDLLLMEQLMHGIRRVADILMHLAKIMPDGVDVFCVMGNHGRAKDLTINFDLLAYVLLEQLLREQPNIKFHISGSSFLVVSARPDTVPLKTQHADWGPHNYGAIHGHQIRRYMDTPAYGLNRAVRRLQDMTGVGLSSVFAGHHHERAVGYQGKWFLNGSWVGGTGFSTEWLMAASRPVQLAFVFHPQHGLAYEIPIYLASQPKLEMDANGLYTKTVDASFMLEFDESDKEAGNAARKRDAGV